MLKKFLTAALLSCSVAAQCFAAEPASPMESRTGETSVVYFTRDLSAAGLKKSMTG